MKATPVTTLDYRGWLDGRPSRLDCGPHGTFVRPETREEAHASYLAIGELLMNWHSDRLPDGRRTMELVTHLGELGAWLDADTRERLAWLDAHD